MKGAPSPLEQLDPRLRERERRSAYFGSGRWRLDLPSALERRGRPECRSS